MSDPGNVGLAVGISSLTGIQAEISLDLIYPAKKFNII